MDVHTKIRLLEENAARFRRLAATDRNQRDSYRRRAKACDETIRRLKGEEA